MNRMARISQTELELFANLHCHSLFGVDDGPKNREQMNQMLDMAYQDGIRWLCFTPHFDPACFNPNPIQEEKAFEEALQYSDRHLPGMKLFLGNEIFCRQGTVNDLKSGKCRTLNGSRFALVEFSTQEDFTTMQSNLLQLLSGGYCPVLAHVERYACLYTENRAEELHDGGVLLQGNCNTFLRSAFRSKAFLKKLIRNGLLDVVADDCHDTTVRCPGLSAGFQYVTKHVGRDQAHQLFFENPINLLQDRFCTL